MRALENPPGDPRQVDYPLADAPSASGQKDRVGGPIPRHPAQVGAMAVNRGPSAYFFAKTSRFPNTTAPYPAAFANVSPSPRNGFIRHWA
jgi:hypothetical protein